MTRPAYVFRAAALLSGGAYAVHQLRFQFGFDAGGAAHHHGHGYLAVAPPVISLLLAAVIGQLLWSAVQPACSGRPRVAFRRAWLLASVCLFGVFVAQELLEGVLTMHHPKGLPGVFGGGGWIAAPLAVVIGTLVALVLRGADAVDRAAPPRLIRTYELPVFAPVSAVAIGNTTLAPPASLLALNRAGRGPPRVR